MRIAIASGKGGTGKTTVATNLVAAAAGRGRRVAYADCDVEEPNGHIFLEPRITGSEAVTIRVPEVDASKCLLGKGESCHACGEACRFSAILPMKDRVLTFPKLCHGCGGCTLACPAEAITEMPRPIGVVEKGTTPFGVEFIQGRLDVGEAMSPPVIRKVVDEAFGSSAELVVLDAPPGASCPVIEAVKRADVVLLVSEPTPFGLSDLKVAVATVRKLGLPHGLLVNRAGTGDRSLYDWCARHHVPILLEITDERGIAESYSRGRLAIDTRPELAERFAELPRQLRKLVDDGPVANIEEVNESVTAEPSAPYPSERIAPGTGRKVTELVVISGKGGTGKTTIAASIVSLAGRAVAADCDVDASDLHLLLRPETKNRWPFTGGGKAVVDPAACSGCGLCIDYCRFDALALRDGEPVIRVDEFSCEGCGVCVDQCPEQALHIEHPTNGELYLSSTSYGPMVHARLGIAEENSGKLVALVRREARAVAESEGIDLVVSDGSPGVGCPVISSITGAQAVLIVTEPTLSGWHDMERVAELTRGFGVKTFACINKADINVPIATSIKERAKELGVVLVGDIPYSPAATGAMVKERPLVEHDDGPAALAIRQIWRRLQPMLKEKQAEKTHYEDRRTEA